MPRRKNNPDDESGLDNLPKPKQSGPTYLSAFAAASPKKRKEILKANIEENKPKKQEPESYAVTAPDSPIGSDSTVDSSPSAASVPSHYEDLPSNDSEADTLINDGVQSRESLSEVEGVGANGNVSSDSERSTLTTIEVNSPAKPIDSAQAVRDPVDRSTKSKASTVAMTRPVRAKKTTASEDGAQPVTKTRPVRAKKQPAKLSGGRISPDRPIGVQKNTAKAKKTKKPKIEDEGNLFPNLDLSVKTPSPTEDTSPKQKLRLTVTPPGSSTASSSSSISALSSLTASPKKVKLFVSPKKSSSAISGASDKSASRTESDMKTPAASASNSPKKQMLRLKVSPKLSPTDAATNAPTDSPSKGAAAPGTNSPPSPRLKLNYNKPELTKSKGDSPKKRSRAGRPVSPQGRSCRECSKKHKACDKTKPICGRCTEKDLECEYPGEGMDLD